MTAVTDRPLRADAARNAERILRAARDVYSEFGPEAAIETIAQRAGVGERTLYRRFPTKAELIRAALDQCIAEDLAPTIETGRKAADPREGLAQLIDAAISLGARERSLLTAARMAERLRERGVLVGTTGPGGHVLKIRPPLIWEHEHVELFLDAFAAALP